MAAMRVVEKLKVPSVMCGSCLKHPFKPVVNVRVNGMKVKALRDTGDARITSEGRRSDGQTRSVTVTMADQSLKSSYPVARVDLFVRGRVEALVLDQPCEDVIVGN